MLDPTFLYDIDHKEELRIALRAVELMARELMFAMPNDPKAGSPEAWLRYAAITLRWDEEGK